MTDKEIGKIAFDKFGLQECDEEYTYFILGYKEAQAKQLRIGGVSKSFALGKTVMVNRCIYGHEFNLGETVDVVDYEPSQTTSWLCSNGKNQWWLSEDEANVC